MIKFNSATILISLAIVFLSFSSCNPPNSQLRHTSEKAPGGLESFDIVLQRHLNAIPARDLQTLKGTLPPDGKLWLILPDIEPTTTVEAFLNYHEAWFDTEGWSFQTEILDRSYGKEWGMAIVEAIYRENERDGKPYFNRLLVSYDLQRIKGQWYIVKDHACSVEKGTTYP